MQLKRNCAWAVARNVRNVQPVCNKPARFAMPSNLLLQECNQILRSSALVEFSPLSCFTSGCVGTYLVNERPLPGIAHPQHKPRYRYIRPFAANVLTAPKLEIN